MDYEYFEGLFRHNFVHKHFVFKISFRFKICTQFASFTPIITFSNANFLYLILGLKAYFKATSAPCFLKFKIDVFISHSSIFYNPQLIHCTCSSIMGEGGLLYRSRNCWIENCTIHTCTVFRIWLSYPPIVCAAHNYGP